MRPHLAPLILTCLLCSWAWSVVTFDKEGYASLNGKTFFPIGIYTYRLDETILAELKKIGFNTVVAGFAPDQLAHIEEAGMKAICVNGSEWRTAAAKSSGAARLVPDG